MNIFLKLIFFQLIILISISILFLYIKSAKKALDRHNEFIIKSILSKFEECEKELDVFKNSISKEINFRDKQHVRGILPITPTIVRVKNSRIMNYLGFN